MNNMKIGEYLGRDVFFEELHSSGFPTSDVQGALILIFNAAPCSDKELKKLCQNLIERGVLSISVAGSDVDTTFNNLLEFLSVFPVKHHVMSGIFRDRDIDTCGVDFLTSSIPAPELFDSWRSHCILSLTDLRTSDSLGKMVTIREMLDPC